jgi:hypothetical protein
MKSNLLFMTVAVAGLAGLTSAQSYERRPGYNGYGLRQRPGVTANVTAAQLTHWMQTSTGSSSATVDRWCYAMGQLVPGGYTCPSPENFGFTGRERNAAVDAQTFLNNLRAFETGANTVPFSQGAVGPGRASPGVDACRQAVENRLRGDGYFGIRITSINAEDRPGGLDRVYGFAEAEDQTREPEGFDFSCGVNLERGEVRSLDVNPR